MINKEKKYKLDIIKHTRERTDIGRPTIFKDKSKYDRKVNKNNTRKEIKQW